MDLPELARDTASKTKAKSKVLIPWLPDPFECPECNVYCDATSVFDYRTAAFHDRATPAWECPECSKTFYRETL